jgi:mRNA degradation ribonuclease J1/J2
MIHYTEKKRNSEEQQMLLNELNTQYIVFFHKLLKQKLLCRTLMISVFFDSCVITF